MKGIKTRVAFHVVEGRIDPDSVKVKDGAIVADVYMPPIDKNGLSWHIREAAGMFADPTTGLVTGRGQTKRLTRLEMIALTALLEAYPRGVTFEMMTQKIGTTIGGAQSSVARLRKQLEGLAEIETIHGVGWVIKHPEES